jgi:acetyl esterase/lipase
MQKRTIAAALFLLLGMLTGCQSLGIFSMHAANGLADMGPYVLSKDLPYGSDPANRLDLYVPYKALRPGAKPAPLVVFFHGGDWSEKYPGKEVHTFVGDALTAHGLAVAIVSYRRYPSVRFPAFIEDGAEAFVWLHENSQPYGVNVDRMFVMGHSAGAHTAGMLAFDEDYIRDAGGDPQWVKGLIGMAGPYVFPEVLEEPELTDTFGLPENHSLTQVVNYVEANEPPALLIAGGKDDRVPVICTQYMADRLKEHRSPVTLKIYPHLNHVMLLATFAAPVRLFFSTVNDITGWTWDRVRELDQIDAAPKPPGKHLVTSPSQSEHGG